MALPGCGKKEGQDYGLTPSALTGAAGAAAAATLASPEVPIFQVSSADTSSASASATGGTPAGPGPCTFDPSTGQFSCPDTQKGGVNLTRKFILRDAAGNVQSAFDKNTTASIEVQTSADGTANRPGGGTVTIHRTGNMITSGLAGAETTHILNGTENGTIDGTWTLPDGSQASEHTTVSDTTTNLVIPVPERPDATGPKTPPYPLSGSRSHATTTVGTHGNDTKTNTSSRTETFDGTAIVQVVMTINGQTKSCTVDLSNHTSTCGK